MGLKGKRILSMMLSVLTTFSLVVGTDFTMTLEAKAAGTGLGYVSFEWGREIYDDVELTHLMSENEEGLQKSWTVDFNPTTSEVTPVVSYGDYVMGGDIMSDLISQEEQSGKKVVFAINGDIYDTTNGVSNGLMIRDGILISTSHGSEAVGFRKDGTAIFGKTSLTITAKAGDQTIRVAHVNKERKLDTNNVYLLTEQFDESTKSTQPGVEVILDVNAKDYRGIKIGKTLTATVNSVNQVKANPDKNTTSIGKGQIALCVNSGSSQYDVLSALEKGQELTIDVENNNADVDWSEAEQAFGVFHVLVKNGVETEGIRNDKDAHPRTVFGIKEDGSVVIFQCDGRQPGFALGMTLGEIIDYMVNEKQCVNVFNLDGGGSSTITATLPGDEKSTILNRPSDGSERANCNALLFTADVDKSEENKAEKLHIYPDMKEGYGTKVMLLENGKLNFRVGATDNNYYPVNLDKDQVRFLTEGGIGEISSDGELTAATGTHAGKVIAQIGDTEIKTDIDVKVVDTITKLTADRSILSVAPSKTTKLSFEAENNGVPVVLTSEALTFKLSDDSLGRIDKDGTFIAGDTQGTGTLEISYKDYSMTMPVEIGKLPVMLNDFEESFEDMGWTWRYFTPERGGWAQMSINYDERFVKTGDGSLRVDYDFATKPLTGTVTCETGPEGKMELEGQPKAIGCWVYGDGNNAWLRIQLAPSSYAGDVFVDWVGWKYVETPIPPTASFPYTLVYGVRVLSTPTTGATNKKGTIYVDGLRAVYDFKNDDTTAPVLVEGTDVSPANGATEVGHQPEITITVKDPEVEGGAYTGINTERTKLWINGKDMDNIIQEVQKDGSVKISYIPSALTKLRSGVNKIKYRVEDNAGNKFFKEWSFTVEGYNVNLIETVPTEEKASAGSTFSYILNANDYKNFEDFELEMNYNPSYVTLLDSQCDSRVDVNSSDINKEEGSIKYSLSGMKNVAKDESNPLIKLTFKVEANSGGQTGIKVKKAMVRETGEVEGTNLILDGYDKEIAFKYTLSWSGSTEGCDTVLTVKDSSGNPIKDMKIKATKGGESIDIPGATDENGQLKTNVFGTYPVGTDFKVWTEDAEGALSNIAEIPVYESLGSEKPEKIVVTTGENPSSSVGISWETSLSIPESQLIIGKSSDLSDGKTLEADGKTIVTSANSHERLYKAWGVSVSDLEPDTTYYYKVGQEGNYSEIKSFQTAKAGEDVTVAFYGDIQGAYDKFPNTIEALKNLYPDVDLSLMAGDVSDSGQLYSEWTEIDNAFGSYLSSGIWGATIGNHDSYFDAQTFTSMFYGPKNGTYSTARNYSFEIGDMVIYNLDTEAVHSYDTDFSGQIARMREVFTNSDKNYKVVLMHRSAYPQNYDESDVRALHTAFDEMDVDLVLSGHDHIYSRTNMDGGNKVEAGSGTYYVVGGCSSGSKYYGADVNGRPWTDVVYDDDNPVFSVLKTVDGQLCFEAYAMEGNETRMIDSFTLGKYKASFDKEQISGPERISAGESAEYAVLIPKNHILKTVKVNGEEVAVSDNKFTVESVNENLEIEAEFYVDYNAIAADVLNEKIAAADEDVTEANKEAQQKLVDEYDSVSDAVKALITEENKAKIESVKTALLKMTPADYSLVYAAMAKIPEDLSIYTEETVNALKEATSKVQEGKDKTEQELVDKWAAEIELAVKNLARKPSSEEITAEALTALIKAAPETVTEDNLMEVRVVVNQYDSASDAVKNLINEAEKEKVEKLRNEILLVADADYSNVYKALSEIPSDLSIYTQDSLDKLNEARDSISWNKKAIDQKEVDGYADSIRLAIAKLVEDVDKKSAKELNERIAAADVEVTEENQEVQKKLLADYDAAGEKVKGYILQMNVIKIEAIRDGIEKLNLADYSAVEAALQKIPTDLSEYTAESVAAVNAARDAVVYGKKKSEQALVDSWAEAIEKAVAALEKRTEIKPEKPVDPEKPMDPENPTEKPVDPEKPILPGEDFEETNQEIVNTGDTSMYQMYLMLFVGATGLILLQLRRKCKKIS